MSELSFDMIGLISALFSTFLLAIQNIFSKKTLKFVDIHHLALLAILSKLSWCLLVPFWFLIDGPEIDFKEEVDQLNYFSPHRFDFLVNINCNHPDVTRWFV